FFFQNEFYSMAIFSQYDEQTAVDFRHYNTRVPNRMVPYKLPAQICDRLSHLLAKMHLESASIDLIKDVDGRYIFLEINQVGQFGFLSDACNYQLEKRVARHLLSLEVSHE